jgi:LemA protein
MVAFRRKFIISSSNLFSPKRSIPMKVGIIIIVVLLILALIFGSGFVSRRNQMAVKREAVNAAWSQVDVVLQRRADLIPNLVATVKGFAVHEEQVFSEIAQARSALIGARTPADKIAANGALDSALGRLLVITENYPQLKSNENFLRLQDELAGTENRIAVERRRYNDTIQDYNTFISLFPNSLVASMSGFTRNDAYFKADEGSRTAPKVNFDFNKSQAPAATTPTPAPAKP